MGRGPAWSGRHSVTVKNASSNLVVTARKNNMKLTIVGRGVAGHILKNTKQGDFVIRCKGPADKFHGSQSVFGIIQRDQDLFLHSSPPVRFHGFCTAVGTSEQKGDLSTLILCIY